MKIYETNIAKMKKISANEHCYGQVLIKLREMTEMSQWSKYLSKKRPNRLSKTQTQSQHHNLHCTHRFTHRQNKDHSQD